MGGCKWTPGRESRVCKDSDGDNWKLINVAVEEEHTGVGLELRQERKARPRPRTRLEGT